MIQGTTVVDSSASRGAMTASAAAAIRLMATVSIIGIVAFWPIVYLVWASHFGYPTLALLVGAALPAAISFGLLLLWRIGRPHLARVSQHRAAPRA